MSPIRWNPQTQQFENIPYDWNARAPDETPAGPPAEDIFAPPNRYGFDMDILKSMVGGYEEVTRALPSAAIDRLAQVVAAAHQSAGGFNPDLSYPGKWAPQWGPGPVTVGQARDALFSASFAVGRRMSGEIYEQAGGGQQGIEAQEDFLQNYSVGTLQGMSSYDRTRGDALRYITMQGRNYAREQYRAMRNPAMPFSALGEEGTGQEPSVLETLRTEGDFAGMAAPPRQPEWFEQVQIPTGGIPLYGIEGIPRITQNVLDRAIPYWMPGGGQKLAAMTPEAREIASKALAAIRRAVIPYAGGGVAGPEEVNPLTASLEASQNDLYNRPDQGYLGGPTVGMQAPEYEQPQNPMTQALVERKVLAQAGLIADPAMALSRAQQAMVAGTRTVTSETYPENRAAQREYAESTYVPAANMPPTTFTPEGALQPTLLLPARTGQPGSAPPPFGAGGTGERSVEELKRQANMPNAPQLTPEEYQRLQAYEKENFADPLDDPVTARLKQVARSTLPEAPSLEDQRFYAQRLHDVLNPVTLQPRPPEEIDNSANVSFGMGGSRRMPNTSIEPWAAAIPASKRAVAQFQGAFEAKAMGGDKEIEPPEAGTPQERAVWGSARAKAEADRLAADASPRPGDLAPDEGQFWREPPAPPDDNPLARHARSLVARGISPDQPGLDPNLAQEMRAQAATAPESGVWHPEERQPTLGGQPYYSSNEDWEGAKERTGQTIGRQDFNRRYGGETPSDAAGDRWRALGATVAARGGAVAPEANRALAQVGVAADIQMRNEMFAANVQPRLFDMLRAPDINKIGSIPAVGTPNAAGGYNDIYGNQTLTPEMAQEALRRYDKAVTTVSAQADRFVGTPEASLSDLKKQLYSALREELNGLEKELTAQGIDPVQVKELAARVSSVVFGAANQQVSEIARESGLTPREITSLQYGAPQIQGSEQLARVMAENPALAQEIGERPGGIARLMAEGGRVGGGGTGVPPYEVMPGEPTGTGAARSAGGGSGLWRRMGGPGQLLYGAYIARRMFTMFAGPTIQQEQAYEQYAAQVEPLAYAGMAGQMQMAGTAGGAAAARSAAQINMGRGGYTLFGVIQQTINERMAAAGPLATNIASGFGLAAAAASAGYVSAGMIGGFAATGVGQAVVGAMGLTGAVGGITSALGPIGLIAGATILGASIYQGQYQAETEALAAAGRVRADVPFSTSRTGDGGPVYAGGPVPSQQMTPTQMQRQMGQESYDRFAEAIASATGRLPTDTALQGYVAQAISTMGAGPQAQAAAVRIAQEAASRHIDFGTYFQQAQQYAAGMGAVQGQEGYTDILRQYSVAPAATQQGMMQQASFVSGRIQTATGIAQMGGLSAGQAAPMWRALGRRGESEAAMSAVEGGGALSRESQWVQDWSRRVSTQAPSWQQAYLGVLGGAASAGIQGPAFQRMATQLEGLGQPALNLVSGMQQGNLGAWSWAAWQGVQGTQLPNAAAYRFQDLSGNPIYETNMRGMMELSQAAPSASLGGVSPNQAAAMTGRYTGVNQASQGVGGWLQSIGVSISNPNLAAGAQISTREYRDRLQAEQMDVMNAGLASQQQGFTAQKQYLWGGGAYTGTPTAGSLWGLQAQQRLMGYESQQYNFAYTGQRMDVQNQFGMMQEQLTGERMQTTNQYNRWSMGFQRGGELQQRGWQREDYQYQDTMRGLQTGWQMEDINEAIRLSGGRDRRHLVEQRERMTLTTNLEGQQIDKTRNRQEQLWAREDEAYNKQKAHQEAMIKLDDKEFALAKSQRAENYKAEKEHLAWQMQEYQKEYDLETRIINLQHDYQADELERSEHMASIQAQLTRDQAEYAKNTTIISEAYGDTAGYVKNLMQYRGLDAIYGPLMDVLSTIAGMDPGRLKTLARFIAGLK